MNPAIQNLVLGKSEYEAINILRIYQCNWRILSREGKNVEGLSVDRDDKRYNLIIVDGKVERVVSG